MAEKRLIWSAAVPQTCWRAKVLTTYLKCGGIVTWLCSASIKSSCESKRRKLSQPRCIEEIYRPKYQYPIERWILPCEYVPPTSEFMANRIFVRSNTFDSSNGNARVKDANEASWDRSDEMKSGYFRVSARSGCVSTYILWPNYMPKTDGRATVIGNENVYTTSDYRTSSNKLDLFADPQRMTLSWRAITQSCIENTNVSSSQCFWIAHFEKFEMCEVKQRATVQDSCLSNYHRRNDMFKYPRNNEKMNKFKRWRARLCEGHSVQHRLSITDTS